MYSENWPICMYFQGLHENPLQWMQIPVDKLMIKVVSSKMLGRYVDTLFITGEGFHAGHGKTYITKKTASKIEHAASKLSMNENNVIHSVFK